MTRPVLQVRPFLQQKLTRSWSHTKQEPSVRPFEDALLQPAELDFENLLKLFAPQCMEHHYFVDPVHEFRRELPTPAFSSMQKSSG